MNLNDFESDPHHATELPVQYEADAVDSNSPAAIPTVAPDALLCGTRAELQARWQDRPEYAAANRAWHEFANQVAAFHPAPQRN